MKQFIGSLIFLVSSIFISAEIYESPVRAGAFESLVVQDQGRLKPFDTFARSQLLLFRGSSSINRQSATDWLLELLIVPEKAFERKVFKVVEKEAILALGIGLDPDYLYSFNELRNGIGERLDSLKLLIEKKPEERLRAETQLLTLYSKVSKYHALSRTLTGLLADIRIENEELAKAIGLEARKAYTYREFMQSRVLLAKELQSLQGRTEGDAISEKESAMVDLVQQLQVKMVDQGSDLIRMIKPLQNQKEGDWFSPWGIMDGRNFSEWEIARIKELEAIVGAFSVDAFADVSAQVALANSSLNVPVHYKAELFYNKSRLFLFSTVLYSFAFLILLLGYMLNSTLVQRIAFASLVLGLFLQISAILLRVYILERPPVSTLYESIIFVSAILVLFACVIEFIRKDTIGLIVGSIAGIVLNYIASRYALDGDTAVMLVAVLDSRFWLLTHVQTITIGYAISLLAGLVAHVYLVIRIKDPTDQKLHTDIFKVSYGVGLVAVFFTTFGTILGGIWGDQSWGRFWGWDPKENGALLIVMWLLVLVHGRLSGHLKELSFSVAMALTPITVAVAWFGVNLLQVGLHSYGFDDGTAKKLLWFCIAEVVFAFGAGMIIHFRNKTPITSPKASS
ncbi:MAG: cytochrome c biogenesis protein CcsA [Verrucomicrobia bacterium]|nr:cytochrome c biogenesis protein CcsA [Verrucomicrobiota bacterium]MDA1066366.1 cytochrome c biogenesis protein CcsA [Verrucomicrobiota bacterium]